MPRRPRVVAPGVAHHITQRGNNRQLVFHSDYDRRLYVDLLARYAGANSVRMLGYCLMSNHVHLVAVPGRPESLARALRSTHSEYAASLNRSENRRGHLWQGRFFSCPLDPAHLATALRYVDLNPVRARLVNSAAEWAWSSAGAHGDAAVYDPLLALDWAEWFGGWDYAQWKQLLSGDDGAGAGWDDLRRSTINGSPFGSPEFVRQMEKQVGRRLRVFECGRPTRSKGTGGIPGVQLGLF